MNKTVYAKTFTGLYLSFYKSCFQQNKYEINIKLKNKYYNIA